MLLIKKILVIEDSINIIKLLKLTLENAGYQVESSRDSDNAIKVLAENKIDLILLDLGLPGISGWEICRIIKADEAVKHIPIIILSGQYVSIEHKVKGLELGADDYILKPFDPRELVSRVKAVLRRIHRDEERAIILGDLMINIERHIVEAGRKQISLTPKEFDLLYLLMKNKNKVMPRDVLMDVVWKYSPAATRTVDTHIKTLRKKLGPKNEDKIKTVSGLGYAFKTS